MTLKDIRFNLLTLPDSNNVNPKTGRAIATACANYCDPLTFDKLELNTIHPVCHIQPIEYIQSNQQLEIGKAVHCKTKVIYTVNYYSAVQLVAESEVITSLYPMRRSEYRLVITEPEATNCFSTNFHVFTNNNQLSFTKFISKLLLHKKAKIK